MNFKIHFLVFWLVLSTLSCTRFESVTFPTPIPLEAHSVKYTNLVKVGGQGTPKASITTTPTHTPWSSPTASNTPFPTSTPSLLPTDTLRPEITPSPIQLNVFEELWEIVNEDYLYQDFNGVDWNKTYQEYLQLISSGLNDVDFYQAMKQMIRSLGDDHSAFFDPIEAGQLDIETQGDLDYVGIGILTTISSRRDRITILLIFPESPAEEAGLRAHDSILLVDGHPIVDETGVRYDLIRGSEGSKVELTVQSPGEEPRTVQLSRRAITSQIPIPSNVIVSPAGKRIGYLQVPTFRDTNIDEKIGDVLKQMSSNNLLDGLIIDNRHNAGGGSDVLSDSLSFFTSGNVGYFKSKNVERPLIISGEDIFGSQKVPLVVLIGDDTASFGEIFSGILGDIGRATIIGENSEGNVEILHVYEFEDGSRAWIANETFIPLNHPNENWEITGIIPDITVKSVWEEITQETDPAILAAVNYFDSLY